MKYFVRSGALQGFPELVRQLGQNPSRLLRDVGLSTAVLHDHDIYLPYIKLAELCERAARVCKEPDFGFRMAQLQGLEVVGALASLLSLQTSVGDALNLLRKNMDFHARGADFDFEIDDTQLSITFDLRFKHQTDCDQLLALSVGLIARGISQLHNNTIQPIQVSLALQGRGSIQNYQRILGCPVQLDSNQNRVRFPKDMIYAAVAIAPETRERLTSQWRTDRQHQLPLSLRDQVERAIYALLPTGECNLEMVAKIIDMHPRSLQIALKANDDSFGLALQRTRQRLACQHLTQGDSDLTTLALNLGFAELSVFSRAFKKWTGQAPRDWRSQTQNEGFDLRA